MSYLVYQKEIGQEGTPHYQGYVEAKSALALSAVKGRLDLPAIHLEPRRGTQEQAIAYCKKAETRAEGPWEFGEPKEQGKRNDLLALAVLAKDGKRKREAFEEMPATYARYYKNYEHISGLFPPTRPDVTVTLLVGKPGTGKTRYVHEHETRDTLWSLPAATPMWFNGYDGHEAALLDDFSGNMPLDLCLRLLDRYALQVPTKGGFVWWVPARVYITSNFRPEEWYDYTARPDHLVALKRRIHTTINFDNPFHLNDLPGAEGPVGGEAAISPYHEKLLGEKKKKLKKVGG